MGEETVDPLRDERVAKIVRKQGMKHCCVTPWSFGRMGEVMHSWLRSPNGIATNSSGQFIVGDIYEVKIFDPTGQCIQHFSLPNREVILDVATDNKDNIYVLVSGSVCEFSNTADLHHKFPVREGSRLTVTNSKVLVLSKSNVDVYNTDGFFACSFGEGTFGEGTFGVKSITAANDGLVMVADCHDNCVHIFSEDGHHLDKFQVQGGGGVYKDTYINLDYIKIAINYSFILIFLYIVHFTFFYNVFRCFIIFMATSIYIF